MALAKASNLSENKHDLNSLEKKKENKVSVVCFICAEKKDKTEEKIRNRITNLV